MNRKQAAQLLHILKVTWPNSTMAANSDDVYFVALARVEFADVQEAVKSAMLTMKFCPSPAELLALTTVEQRFGNPPYHPPLQAKAERVADIERWYANGNVSAAGRQDLIERMERTYGEEAEVLPAEI